MLTQPSTTATSIAVAFMHVSYDPGGPRLRSTPLAWSTMIESMSHPRTGRASAGRLMVVDTRPAGRMK
jgi:hypothetical protein